MGLPAIREETIKYLATPKSYLKGGMKEQAIRT